MSYRNMNTIGSGSANLGPYSNAGSAPRRLLQTHGAFINTVLAPSIRLRRRHGAGKCFELPSKNEETKDGPEAPAGYATVLGTAQLNSNSRLNSMYSFVNNDEVFDARAGEVLVASHANTGFSNHRRGALFSSLNGFKVQNVPDAPQGKVWNPALDPEEAFLQSDIRFIGLCQNDFVSSDSALQDQGMVCQMSGIKVSALYRIILFYASSFSHTQPLPLINTDDHQRERDDDSYRRPLAHGTAYPASHDRAQRHSKREGEGYPRSREG